jgi:hypothetical protein
MSSCEGTTSLVRLIFVYLTILSMQEVNSNITEWPSEALKPQSPTVNE